MIEVPLGPVLKRSDAGWINSAVISIQEGPTPPSTVVVTYAAKPLVRRRPSHYPLPKRPRPASGSTPTRAESLVSIDQAPVGDRTRVVEPPVRDQARALGLTRKQFSTIHARLREEAVRLREEVAQATLHVVDQNNITLRDRSDEIDVGVLQANLTADTELAEVCMDLLAQSEHALSRLEAGTYGTCEVCYETIAPGRLLALARATTCVGCQTKADRRSADR